MLFILDEFFFLLAIGLVFFIPGWIFLKLFRKETFNALEKFVLSFVFGIIFVDFLMLLLGKFNVAINRISLLSGTIILIILFAIIIKSRKPLEANLLEKNSTDFSKLQLISIILILFLTIFLKTAYLKDSVVPTSTDLGHHMYWTEKIAREGKIPVYEEQDIIEKDGRYEISQPKKIADFIVGEHLPLAAIGIITGKTMISSLPMQFLLLVNVFSILAVFILALRLFSNQTIGINSAIFSLLLIGPIYAISSSQAKFVSGGVIGNLIGNLFIPVTILLLFRGLKEKSPGLVTLALIVLAGLGFSHHLSSLVFLFSLIFIFLITLFFNYKNLPALAVEWKNLILNKRVLLTLAAVLFFSIFIYTPAYLQKEAIDTALGTPIKATRIGFSFFELSNFMGEPRMALGLAGLGVLLAASFKKRNCENETILGWSLAILIMTLAPNWLFVDIPSNRIANYAVFPLVISGGYALAYIFESFKRLDSRSSNIAGGFIFTILLSGIVFLGAEDNASSLREASLSSLALKTFHSSRYLSEKISAEDMVLKDHNYIVADAWMKLLFLRDYNFPLSRAFFKRYDDPIRDREKCTLWMISTPSSDDAKKCYADLGVDFIMVNSRTDSAQFEKNESFSKIYESGEIAIFEKL